MHRSRSHDAVIRFHDESGSVIETHEHGCRFALTCGIAYHLLREWLSRNALITETSNKDAANRWRYLCSALQVCEDDFG